MQKDRLKPFPFGVSTESSTSSSLGLTEALNHITTSLCSLDTKMSNVDAKMSTLVTTDQMQALKNDIMVDFERHISDLKRQLEKLEKENSELRERVDELERRLKSLSSSSSSTSGPDIAFRRISFIGFPTVDDQQRIQCVHNWMTQHLNGLTFHVGNIHKGPVQNRKLTSVSYVEFPDSDVRNLVLKRIKSDGLSCKYKDSVILIKPALSQVIRERIWALNTAYDIVKGNSLSNGKVVDKRKDKDRAILVDGQVVFDQFSTSVGLGKFLGAYASLVLPGRSGV